MPSFAVDTAFNSKDRVSKAFGRMDRAAGKFGRTADRAFSKATRKAAAFQSITKGILAAGAVQRGLSGLARGIGAVTTQFVDFDQATIGAASRFRDIGPSAADFEFQLSRIRDRAREAGQATEFTSAQAASALDFLARAGWESAQAFGGLNSMINLATATGSDFARVADISSDLMGSFGLNTENTVQQLKNLNRLNDVLVKTVNSTNVNMENLFDTMTQVGQIAKGVLGASLEDVASLTGALGNAGIKGSRAMTALKNAYLRLAAPTGDGADLLKSLNVTLADGEGGARRMTDVMEELGQKIGKMSVTKQAKALDLIFGKRAIAGGKNIIDNIKNINKLRVSLENAGGTAAATAERMRKSIGNRMKTLGSAASELGFKILEAFEVRGERAINRMTEAIRAFDIEPVLNALEFSLALFKNIIAVISPFKEAIGLLIAGWLAYAAVMKIVAAAQLIVAFTNPVTAIIVSLALLGAFLISWWDEMAIGWGIIGKTFDSFIDNFIVGLKIITNMFGNVMGSIFGVADKVLSFLGIEALDKGANGQEQFRTAVNADASGEPVAPNKEQAEARQDIRFSGRMEFANAPEGATVTGQTTGAPDINIDILGGA